MDPKNTENGEVNWFITVYKTYDNHITFENEIEYNISLQSSPNNFCPGFCNTNYAKCSDETSYQCECFIKSSIGPDCNSSSYIVTSNQETDISIGGRSWSYLMYNIDDFDVNYEIEVGTHWNNAGISFFFKDITRGSKPNFVDNYNDLPSKPNDKSYFYIQKSYLQTQSKRYGL
jgi:hypothetical protein